MKNKQVVRLTESQLHNIIEESIKKIINEMNYNVPEDEEALQEHLDLISQFMHGYFQGGGMTSSNPYEYLSSAIEQTQYLLSGLNILARRRKSN